MASVGYLRPSARINAVVIQVNGRKLPGIRCNPGPDGPHENVHVGIGSKGIATELVRGDAPAASWRVEIRAVPMPDGSIDYRGPLVDGKRGDRFLYLNWVNVEPDGGARLFRRAKVMLSGLEPAVVRRAIESSRELHCTVELTDAKGNPSCARFAPEAISWRVLE